MTRAEWAAVAAVALLLIALWAAATWAFTVRVMAAGAGSVEYEWRGERA